MTDLFGNEEIRALSWKQPYAELMLRGKIETRTWKTDYRGLVLICASKQSYYTDQLRRISGANQMWRMGQYLGPGDDYCGKAMAIGRLVDCRKMKPEDEDDCFVEYWDKLYCHIYKDVQQIEIFPWKGQQGWKILNEIEKQKIKIL